MFTATSVLSGQVPDSLAPAFEWDPNDPRVGLGAGWMDAESAISNLEHIGSVPRPEGFFDPATPGAENLKNSDLAFQGDYLFQGNYNGFQVFDISNPRDPQLEAGIICPTEQGDLTIYGDLLIVSAQSRASRLDCGVEGVADSVSVKDEGYPDLRHIRSTEPNAGRHGTGLPGIAYSYACH